MKAVLAIGVPALLCCAGVVFVLATQVFTGNSYVEGVVLDGSTGMPLPAVEVAVSNRGWGFVNGRLVWDKDYIYPATTDQNGRFHIVYDVGSSAHVTATKQGYQPFDNWYESNSTLTIQLQRIHPVHRVVPLFTIRLPYSTNSSTRLIYPGMRWNRKAVTRSTAPSTRPGKYRPVAQIRAIP